MRAHDARSKLRHENLKYGTQWIGTHKIFGKLGLGARHQSVSIQINENGNLKLTNYNQNEDELVAERSATSSQRNRDGEGVVRYYEKLDTEYYDKIHKIYSLFYCRVQWTNWFRIHKNDTRH